MFRCWRRPDVYLQSELLKLWRLRSLEFNNSWLNMLVFSSPCGFTQQQFTSIWWFTWQSAFSSASMMTLTSLPLSLLSNWITWWLTTCSREVVGGVKLINTGGTTAAAAVWRGWGFEAAMIVPKYLLSPLCKCENVKRWWSLYISLCAADSHICSRAKKLPL